MGLKITFHTHKGGTGKTTLCYNAALCLAAQGSRVLCVDLDPQGSLSNVLVQQWEKTRGPDGGARWVFKSQLPYSGASTEDLFRSGWQGGPIMKATHGIDLVHMRPNSFGAIAVMEDVDAIARFIRAIDEIATGYDYVFADCPPTATSFVLGVLSSMDYFVIPQTVAANTQACAGELAIIGQLEGGESKLLGIVLNQIYRRSVEHADAESVLRQVLGSRIFTHTIHNSVTVDTSLAHNTPLRNVPGGFGSRREMEGVVDEMLDRICLSEGGKIQAGTFKGTQEEARRIIARLAAMSRRAKIRAHYAPKGARHGGEASA